MDLVKESREYALSEIEKFGLPSNNAFEISEKKAIDLAKILKADRNIVKVGHSLMDIKLGQAIKENRPAEHVKMSVEASKTFLKKFQLDKETENKILNCVEAHHAKVPFVCKEAEICANADCYRFVHPKGFFDKLVRGGAKGLDLIKALDEAEFKLDEKRNILSLDICKNELEETYKNLKKYIRDAREF